jgi:hypothetical protein
VSNVRVDESRSLEGLPYTSNTGAYARRPLVGEKLTTKKLLPLDSMIASTPDRDALSFLNPVNPKRTWNYGGLSTSRGAEKIRKKLEKISDSQPGCQDDSLTE